MTQAKPRFANFDEYLSYSEALDGRYLLVTGELVELPPESELNNFIARSLLFALVSQGIVPLRLVVIHTCEVQVPVLQPKDSANRYPDLVVLREEHIPLAKRRLTITLDMPPPQLVAEVVSPGEANRDRDYIRKREQYAQCGIPEYWIIDPEAQVIRVLELQGEAYGEPGVFRGDAAIVSPAFGELTLTASQILGGGL